MKNRFLLSLMFLLLIVALYIPSSYSANPTFSLTLTNAHPGEVLSGTQYEFDIYMLATSTSSFELGSIAASVVIDKAALNGGTISASWTTNGLIAAVMPTNFLYTVGSTQTVVKIVGKTNPGLGNGNQISGTAPGTFVGRLRLTNSVTFASVPGNVNWGTTAQYPRGVNVYVNGSAVNIATSGTYISELNTVVLPVELSSFASTAQGRSVVLSWSTKTEKNSDRFEVQRSASGSSFVTVSSVKAANLSNSTKTYTYTDNKLQSGKYQYRLKMVDNDGTFSYSQVSETEVALPKDFQVSQNYPNPFNPSTRIDYQVPVDARVMLDVYNIAGQKVAEVVNQEQSAGYYTVNFGQKLSTGVYIYRLTASDKVTGNNFSSIKKMMVLK